MKKKELLLFSIGIFLTVVAWLVADIYHAATQEKIKTKTSLPNLQKYEISRELLEKLNSKQE